MLDEEKHINDGLRAPRHNSQRRLREPVTEPTLRHSEEVEVARPESRSETLPELRLLAASMAHEIRNSLAGVRGAVEVLGRDYPEQSERYHVFKEMLRRLDGVNNLVGDLLEYTRPLVAKKELLGLLESLDGVLSALTIDTRLQCITIVKEYRCDPVLRADPNLLERLFLNLTLNAIQAMKFGCGMEKGVQERIFGPFFTTKAGGSRLGLFLCKKYVEAHDGSIEVKTEPGHGSTFTVLLPRSRSMSPSRQGR